MTTLVKITNAGSSNGDVIIDGVNTCSDGKMRGVPLRPGESKEICITTSSTLVLTETWPTRPKNASDGDVLACGADGSAWAKAFTNQFPAADEDMMRAWFQNAIEAACMARRDRMVDEAREIQNANLAGPLAFDPAVLARDAEIK